LTSKGAQRLTPTYVRWRLAMRRSRLFRPGERIGIAVSGGPDSILLLDFASVYAGEAGVTLSIVHFNHHLRGAESDADELFVRQRARELGLEFHSSGAGVAGIARAKKRNLEATARELRYSFFFGLVRQGKLDKVATAHTANDQAETVLLRLVRGAGTRGLGGIHPVLEGGVVRPFLTLTRAEVEAEVALRGLDYRADSSNRETRFARNRLRERVLPLLESEFNPRVVEALAAFADHARDDDVFLQEQARERSQAWLRREGGTLRIPAGRLSEFPPAIARRILRQMVAEALHGGARAPGPVAISHAEMEDLLRLAAEGQSGKRMTLGVGVEVRKEFEWLVIGGRQREDGLPSSRASGFRHVIRPPTTVAITQIGLRLRFGFADTIDANTLEAEYNDNEAVWLDSLNPAAPLILRSWRAGDRFHALGSTNPVKLKELFQRRRIPAAERAWWPVLESAGRIVWVRGFVPVRCAGRESKRVLRIREESLPGTGERDEARASRK
jgi:tRNA(Ile)-lysidine synthase